MLNLGFAVKPNNQVQPKVRPTPDGGWTSAGFDNDPKGNPPFGYDVYMQRLDAAGVAQWADGGILFADLGMSSTQDYGVDVDERQRPPRLSQRPPAEHDRDDDENGPRGNSIMGHERAAGRSRTRLPRQSENHRDE